MMQSIYLALKIGGGIPIETLFPSFPLKLT